MNRKILFSLAILIVIAVAAWGIWRNRVIGWRRTRSTVRTAGSREVRKLPPSSEELIAKALAAKEIDYETSLLYRTFALFGDPRLPQKYVTRLINLDAGTSLSREIFMHEDQLSPATQSTLAPFLARPNDPKSILYMPRSISAGIFLLPTVAAAGNWTKLPAAGGLVNVWTNTDFQLAAPLQTYADDVSLVWPKLRELIRAPTPDDAGYPSLDINPDSAIDVYILPLGQINPRLRACGQDPGNEACTFAAGGADGYTFPAIPYIDRRSSSAYVTLNGSLAGDALVATLAHELFHTSQFSYSNAEEWLAESTATWGEFRVMQNLGRSTAEETQYLRDFFSGLDTEPLDLFEEMPGTHQYGAFLYFVFAAMERGDAVVSDVWAYTSGYQLDEAKAVDAVFPFKDHFRDFALRNWNQEPVPKLYKTVDSGLSDFQSRLNSYLVLKPNHTESLSLDLKELTARYDTLDVTDNIAKLRVNLADVAQNANAGVDAIVSIANKQDEVQHWTSKPEVTFCRDDLDERVDTIVLIVSNASLRDNLQGKIGVEPSSEPCKDRVADLTLSTTYTVDVDQRDKDSGCKDHLVVSHSGTAHYTLLPYGTGTSNLDPEVLSTSPRSGFQADRTGVFTANLQGGGNCTASKTRGMITWTYSLDSPRVTPKSFPSIGVRLRPGEYGVDESLGADTSDVSIKGEIVVPGGPSIPWNTPGPALGGYAYLVQQTIQAVDDAMHGKFQPYSKRFSASHRVTETVKLQPNDFGPTGTGTVDISYQLTVSRQ
jgi:hypothetical protein